MTIENEQYHVSDRILFREVKPKFGRPYLHTCSEAIFKAVLAAIDEAGGRTFTGADLVGWIDAPPCEPPPEAVLAAAGSARGPRPGFQARLRGRAPFRIS